MATNATTHGIRKLFCDFAYGNNTNLDFEYTKALLCVYHVRISE